MADFERGDGHDRPPETILYKITYTNSEGGSSSFTIDVSPLWFSFSISYVAKSMFDKGIRSWDITYDQYGLVTKRLKELEDNAGVLPEPEPEPEGGWQPPPIPPQPPDVTTITPTFNGNIAGPIAPPTRPIWVPNPIDLGRPYEAVESVLYINYALSSVPSGVVGGGGITTVPGFEWIPAKFLEEARKRGLTFYDVEGKVLATSEVVKRGEWDTSKFDQGIAGAWFRATELVKVEGGPPLGYTTENDPAIPLSTPILPIGASVSGSAYEETANYRLYTPRTMVDSLPRMKPDLRTGGALDAAYGIGPKRSQVALIGTGVKASIAQGLLGDNGRRIALSTIPASTSTDGTMQTEGGGTYYSWHPAAAKGLIPQKLKSDYNFFHRPVASIDGLLIIYNPLSDPPSFLVPHISERLVKITARQNDDRGYYISGDFEFTNKKPWYVVKVEPMNGPDTASVEHLQVGASPSEPVGGFKLNPYLDYYLEQFKNVKKPIAFLGRVYLGRNDDPYKTDTLRLFVVPDENSVISVDGGETVVELATLAATIHVSGSCVSSGIQVVKPTFNASLAHPIAPPNRPIVVPVKPSEGVPYQSLETILYLNWAISMEGGGHPSGGVGNDLRSHAGFEWIPQDFIAKVASTPVRFYDSANTLLAISVPSSRTQMSSSAPFGNDFHLPFEVASVVWDQGNAAPYYDEKGILHQGVVDPSGMGANLRDLGAVYRLFTPRTLVNKLPRMRPDGRPLGSPTTSYGGMRPNRDDIAIIGKKVSVGNVTQTDPGPYDPSPKLTDIIGKTNTGAVIGAIRYPVTLAGQAPIDPQSNYNYFRRPVASIDGLLIVYNPTTTPPSLLVPMVSERTIRIKAYQNHDPTPPPKNTGLTEPWYMIKVEPVDGPDLAFAEALYVSAAPTEPDGGFKVNPYIDYYLEQFKDIKKPIAFLGRVYLGRNDDPYKTDTLRLFVVPDEKSVIVMDGGIPPLPTDERLAAKIGVSAKLNTSSYAELPEATAAITCTPIGSVSGASATSNVGGLIPVSATCSSASTSTTSTYVVVGIAIQTTTSPSIAATTVLMTCICASGVSEFVDDKDEHKTLEATIGVVVGSMLVATQSDEPPYTPNVVMTAWVEETAVGSVNLGGVAYVNPNITHIDVCSYKPLVAWVCASGVLITDGGPPVVQDPTTCLVFNCNTTGLTTYDNFPFDSYVQTDDGTVYAAGPLGIYKLGGNTDLELPIISKVVLGYTDLGVSYKKRVDNVFVGHVGNGPIDVVLESNGLTKKYTVVGTSEAYPKTLRARPAMGHVGRYWRMTLQSASKFQINDVMVSVAVSKRIT